MSVGSGLRRALTATLMVFAMASCAARETPLSGSLTAAPQTASPSPLVDDPATSPAAQPNDFGDQHVAAGLAFVRFVDDDSPVSQVFVVEPDGELRQLTGGGPASRVGASRPLWSPDRSQVAFGPPKTGAGPDQQLSVINADGTDERPIAVLREEYSGPFGWSPDGKRLLWGDFDNFGGPAMWVADVGTGEVTPLGAGHVPRWLPDGRQVSFVRGVEGRVEGNPAALTQVVYILDLETGDEREFATARDAIWSPDGTAVLLEDENGSLLMADADGSDPRELVTGSDPVWSPDSTRVVFAYDVNQDGLPLLAVVDRDREPLWSRLVGSSPTWSPDGSRLAVEILHPNLLVNVVDAANGEVLWQTRGEHPAWAP